MNAKVNPSSISFRPITDNDLEFLYKVYASTRSEEMAVTVWRNEEIDAFLRMQFRLQHTQYLQNNPHASFNVILVDTTPAGSCKSKRTDCRCAKTYQWKQGTGC
ncbi:MAG: GCN5-related N-acetyltransferase [Candidatus Brocadiaceae bacterium]|nr:GCN5-related N-acetyltransferase [Candidatus Brocadiaceae bacterium]